MRRAYRLAPPSRSHYRASLEKEVRHIRIPGDFCVYFFFAYSFFFPRLGAPERGGQCVCLGECRAPLETARWRKGESATRRPPMRVLLLSADASPMSHKSASATLKGRAFPPSPTLLPFSLPSCACLSPLCRLPASFFLSLFEVFTRMIYTSRSSVVLSSLPFFAPPAFCVATGGGRLSFFFRDWLSRLMGWLVLPVACRASFAVWGLGALTSVAAPCSVRGERVT